MVRASARKTTSCASPPSDEVKSKVGEAIADLAHIPATLRLVVTSYDSAPTPLVPSLWFECVSAAATIMKIRRTAPALLIDAPDLPNVAAPRPIAVHCAIIFALTKGPHPFEAMMLPSESFDLNQRPAPFQLACSNRSPSAVRDRAPAGVARCAP